MSGPDSIGQVGDSRTLVAFFPGVPLAQRDDVEAVLRYAQLFASHTYDFETQWHSWMQYYRSRLEKCGFVRQSLVVKDSVLLGSAEDVDTASFKVLGTGASEQVRELVRNTVTRLGIRQLALAYFENGRSSMQLGSFQIVAGEMEAGATGLLLCSVRVNTDQACAGTRRLIMYCKGGSYRFDPLRYEPQRQTVDNYLRNRTNALIRSLNPRDFDNQ